MDSEPAINMKRAGGFTLVEVLVATGVVAIGLTGILATVNGMINASSYLRDKVLADWVAQNHITELRLEDAWPETGRSTDDVEMAGQEWRIATDVSETPVEALRRLEVSVSYREAPDEPLVTVSAFVGEPQAQAPPRSWRAGNPRPGGEPGESGEPGEKDDEKGEEQ